MIETALQLGASAVSGALVTGLAFHFTYSTRLTRLETVNKLRFKGLEDRLDYMRDHPPISDETLREVLRVCANYVGLDERVKRIERHENGKHE